MPAEKIIGVDFGASTSVIGVNMKNIKLALITALVLGLTAASLLMQAAHAAGIEKETAAELTLDEQTVRAYTSGVAGNSLWRTG